MSLLSEAKKIKVEARTQEIDKERVELAVAWARGELKTTQVSEVLGIKAVSRGSVYNFLAMALRQHIQNGGHK